MKPVLNEEKCPAMGNIAQLFQHVRKTRCHMLLIKVSVRVVELFLIMKNVMSVAFVSPNAADLLLNSINHILDKENENAYHQSSWSRL